MEQCEHCYSRHWRAKLDKNGVQVKHRNGNLVYLCVRCGTAQEEENRFLPSAQKIRANIIYIDVEIAKSVYFNYGRRVPSKYLRSDDLISEYFMISWAASYVGSSEVWSDIVTPKEAIKRNDGNIVKRLHSLMQSAEIIAGHNVIGFDMRKCNTRFDKHGLPPIVGKKYLDTLRIARSVYDFESNSLGDLCREHGIKDKDDINNADWIRALAGHKPTLDKIHKYNRGDVINGKEWLNKMMPAANKKPEYGALKK